jgi:hypothetical protein
MEAGCRKFFVVVIGIALFLGAITVLKSCGVLEMIDNPGSVVPDNVPIPGK